MDKSDGHSSPETADDPFRNTPERRWNVRRSPVHQPAVEGPGHEWVALSTALREGWIMVQCVKCGSHGTIDSPTTEEWAEAFYSPSFPYLWDDDTRVAMRHPSDSCCTVQPSLEAEIKAS